MAIPHSVPPLVRAARIATLSAVAALLVLACGDDPNRSDPAAAAGLIVLAGQPADPSLTTYDARGSARPLALPEEPIAWVSAGRRGTLIATTTSGGLRLSDRVLPDPDQAIAWRAVPGPATELPAEPLSFATWSGNGLRVAAVATDFEANHSLVVVDPVGDASLIIPLDRPVLPAAPAWVDEQRVGVPMPAELALVDASTGDIAPGPSNVRLVTVAGDGSTVAAEVAGGGGVEIATTADWLAERGRPQATIDGGEVGALALDRRAGRLAVVWERDGQPGLIVVYGREAGWREIGRLELPGRAAQGTVSWLP